MSLSKYLAPDELQALVRQAVTVADSGVALPGRTDSLVMPRKIVRAHPPPL